MVTRNTPLRSTAIRYGNADGASKTQLKSVKTKHSAWGQRSEMGKPFSPFQSRPFFEAASSSPRLIQAPDSGPNSSNSEIDTLRTKSRWMYANDPFYRQACRQVGNNTVHYGIKPNIRDKVLLKIWKRWVREADARGQVDFYGMQHFGSIVTARDGESLFRIRRRRPGDMKSGINFQLQALESDHMPLDKTVSAEKGNIIVSGVELDPIERVAAYWLYEFHPKDWAMRGVGTGLPQRVLAEEVIHMFLPDRYSGTRGYPWGASALTTSERYRTYDDVELERKIVSSSRGGYYKKPRHAGDEETMFDQGENGEVIFRPMEPNEWIEVPEGWDIEQATPAVADTNYADYKRENHSGLAVAFGMAVELITMNWKFLTSDRQYRGLMLEFIRHVESIQHHMLVQTLCQRVWELVVSEAHVNGLWKPAAGKTIEDYFDVEWITPKRGYIHPVQDVTAVALAIEKGLESRKRAVAGNGEDVEDIDIENEEDVARAAGKGLRYTMFGLDAPPQPTGIMAQMEQYATAVRAGLITPQLADEIELRKQMNYPALSDEAIALWEVQKGARQPITLAKPAGQVVAEGQVLVDPETGEPMATGIPAEV